MTTLAERPMTLLDPEAPARGPNTARIVRRAMTVLTGVEVVALALIVLGGERLSALGVGLALPGAGLPMGRLWWLTPVALVLFAIALFGWLLVGIVLGPPLVWATAAVLSAVAADGRSGDLRVAVPVAVAVLVGAAGIGDRIRHDAARARGRELNRVLSSLHWPEPTIGAAAPATDAELAAVRPLADLALQPLDSFDGFTTIDQFREAAWRYQLTTAGWTLSLAQHGRYTAFDGWLGEAQRNLIVKHLAPKVWTYWRYENLVGNLRWDPDPIHRENVMLSGYLLLSLGLYEGATGDRRFCAPGALTFDDGSHRYVYDADSIAGHIARQMSASYVCAYPCEPNWTYLICNVIALSGITAHDNATGSDFGAELRPRFREALEREFTQHDGSLKVVRSKHLGAFLPGTARASDLYVTFLLNGLYPDIAARQWAIYKHRFVRIDDDGFARLTTTPLDNLDPGNYRRNEATAYSVLAASAREMNEPAIVEATLRTIDRNWPADDTGNRRGLSSFTRNMTAMGRLNVAGGLHAAVNGLTRYTGPRLVEAPRADVVVRAAQPNGDTVSFVLDVPAGSREASTDFVLDRLRPGATYLAGDGTVTAGHDGRATWRVRLTGPTTLVLREL
jgi:hypothetical protein